MTDDKKPYVAPSVTVIKIESTPTLMASSDNHGRANACAHGSHAWFCDEDE